MKITKRQLKKIIKEEYSRLKAQNLISESSYGSSRVELFPESMTFMEMQDKALDLLEDLLDGGHVLIPLVDSDRLLSFVEEMAADGEEDFVSLQPLINIESAGENDSWSMR